MLLVWRRSGVCQKKAKDRTDLSASPCLNRAQWVNGSIPSEPRASEHASKQASQSSHVSSVILVPPETACLSACLSPPREQQGAPLAACNLPAFWASRHRLQLPLLLLLLLCTRATGGSPARIRGPGQTAKLSCPQRANHGARSPASGPQRVKFVSAGAGRKGDRGLVTA
jgi:hypothetical protein